MLAASLGKYKKVVQASTTTITVIGITRDGVVVADTVEKIGDS